MDLKTEIRYLRGVGPARSRQLSRLGINTIGELLLHAPREYLDRRIITEIRSLVPGMEANVSGTVASCDYLSSRGGRRRFQAVLEDGTGSLRLTFFNYRFIASRLGRGTRVIASGNVDPFGGMVHPGLIFLDEEQNGPLVLPVYPLTQGITQATMRKLVRAALEKCRGRIPEILPRRVTESLDWSSREEIFSNMHFPPDPKEGERARRALALEELYLHQSLLQRVRSLASVRSGIPMRAGGRAVEEFRNDLPFDLTGAQERAVEEIAGDMAEGPPMRRLLQGDVGSGKTVVAAAACIICARSGYQCAVVAPTEVLASQHWRNLSGMLASLRIETRLLTGGTGSAQRKELLGILTDGSLDVLIGTHAVLEDNVVFPRLGLCIIDEQHKFGVEQRDRLISGREPPPHFMLMSATPIPRTLAMSLYGDLDVSVLDEMPPGRGKVTTRVVDRENRAGVYEFLNKRLSAGEKAFVVYPLREASEELDLRDATTSYGILRKGPLGRFGVGLLTGSMSSNEKMEVTGRFLSGEIALLVSTTVIEVGLDVPEATVMVVSHADRFGLSQLHQLRGRIGRSGRDAWCFLMKDDSCSGDGAARLAILESTDDGFEIARQDLKLRGPGEIAGTRQHGLPSFRIASLADDRDLLAEAASIAAENHDWERLQDEYHWRFGESGVPEI